MLPDCPSHYLQKRTATHHKPPPALGTEHKIQEGIGHSPEKVVEEVENNPQQIVQTPEVHRIEIGPVGDRHTLPTEKRILLNKYNFKKGVTTA